MQALLKKGLTVVLLAAIAAPVTAIPVAAERGAIADRDTRDRPTVWRAKPAVPAKHAAKQVANHRAQVRHAQTHKAKPHPAHANSHVRATRSATGSGAATWWWSTTGAAAACRRRGATRSM